MFSLIDIEIKRGQEISRGRLTTCEAYHVRPAFTLAIH